MNDHITRLLTEALTQALKDALVPIVREAVTEALASLPKADQTTEDTSVTETRLSAIEERMDSLESDLSDKVDSSDIEDAVTNAIDSGSFSIEFRG